MNKQLTYSDPPYKTYMFLANHGVLAMQNPNGYNWFLNNTVQIICERRFIKEGYGALELRTNPRGFRANDNIEKVDVSTQFCIKDSMKIAKAMLDDNYYIVYDTVDDYYIEGKSFYGERHFYHDGIILGYDDEDDAFTMAAYDKTWNYNVFKTPRNGFERALYKSWERNQFPRFVASKPLGNAETFNMPFIKSELLDYISSDLKKYPIEGNNQVSGIVTLDYTIMYLNMLIDSLIPYEKLDWRIMRMMWEHKKCMCDRIFEIEKSIGISNFFSDNYKKIVSESNILRLQFAKCHIRENKDLLKMISKKLELIKISEKKILTELLSNI